MSVKMPDETIIDKLFINTVITTGSIPPPIKPVENDKYRFYHCRLEWYGLSCKPVENSSVLPEKDNTKLLFVPKYLPKCADKYVLKYSFIPREVYIENK